MAAVRFDRRLIPVLLAGCVIAALCVWRVTANRPAGYNAGAGAPTVWRPAPGFEALDARNQMFRLERYLGRHRVLIVFVPAEREGFALALRQLRQRKDELALRDVKVVVLSPALPQQHRDWLESVGGSSASVLTDLQGEIAARWGVPAGSRPVAFLVDRKGEVPWENDVPEPTAGDLAEVLKQLVSDKVRQ